VNKNVAGQKVTLLAINTSTNAPVTGDAANLTAYVSKDDGAVTVLADTSATELDATNAPGLYSFDLAQGETNANKLIFSGKSATANVKLIPVTVYTRPANFQALSIDASGLVDLMQAAADKVWSTATRAITDKAGFSLSSAGVQAIWDALSSALTTANSIGKRLVDNLTGDAYARLGTPAGASVSADVAAVKTVTDAILDDTGTSGVVVAAASKTGYRLSSTGIQDIWDALTSALSAVGSIGKLLVDNVNATISSRASQTSVDTVDDFLDTEIAAIKAKTDNLPADPADASDVASAFTTVNGKLDTIDDLIDTEVGAIKAVTDKLDDTLEDDAGTYRFTTNALEQAPAGGGGGTTDWTADERTAIRSILGIPGSGTTPADPSVGILDTIRDKTTNLPSDPADASVVAGLIAAVEAKVDTVLADTNELQTDWVNGGRLDTILDARASQASVDDLPTNAELATALGTADDAVLAAIAALNNLSSAGAQAAAAAALTAYTAATAAQVAAVQTAVLAKLPSALSANGNMKADVQEVNETPLQGDGTIGNPWGPA
jgi:hypothetical protein